MDPNYLSYTFGNIYRNTFVIHNKGKKGWITLRCIQIEYGDNCVIDSIKGAQITVFTNNNGKLIKARYSKYLDTYIGYDNNNGFILTKSNQIINRFNN